MLNDGWIEWGGDAECPVPDGTKVDIKFRDGDVFFGENTNWDWSWDEDEQGGADIIAYRVIENDGSGRISEELKPCPFCGNSIIGFNEDKTVYGNKWSFADCPACGVRGAIWFRKRRWR